MHFAIVGAGPAGAALAYLLARAGGEVTLLERQTDFAREFRGEVLMPSGLDAIAQMGLAGALGALPHGSVERMRVVSQPALLEMLAREAGQWPGFRLERGFTVRDLVVRDGAVAGVRGDSLGGPREVTADWVIGADGRASATRKPSRLDRTRPAQSFDIVWCRLPLPSFHAGQGPAHRGTPRRRDETVGSPAHVSDGMDRRYSGATTCGCCERRARYATRSRTCS